MTQKNQMMYTLIFKTNIQTELDLKEIATLMSANNSLLNWNVDREDIDKILRVKSMKNDALEIISALNKAGYSCEELPD